MQVGKFNGPPWYRLYAEGLAARLVEAGDR